MVSSAGLHGGVLAGFFELLRPTLIGGKKVLILYQMSIYMKDSVNAGRISSVVKIVNFVGGTNVRIRSARGG